MKGWFGAHPGPNEFAEASGLEHCKARCKSTGERCKKWPSNGYKVCYFHGAHGSKRRKKARDINQGGRPPVTGRYSKALTDSPPLLALYEQYKEDPELTDLAGEIALSRARLSERLQRDVAKVDKADALDSAIEMFVNLIGRLVERKHKIDYGETYTVNVTTLTAMAAQFATIVNECVAPVDPEGLVRAEIKERLERLFRGAPQ